MNTTPMFFCRTLLLLLFITFNIQSRAQTTLSAGDIAFTGYIFNNTAPPAGDAFSFVLLANITSGTQVRFTDNGWLGSSFRTGESDILWTSNAAYAAGTEITITSGASTATLNNSSSAGSLTVSGTSPFSLGFNGDQIICYQGSSLSSSATFITAIHSNVYSTTNGDPVTTTASAWDGTTNNSAASGMPTGLTGGATAIWLGTQGDISSEAVNAKFNCSGNLSTVLNVKSSIYNFSNWTKDLNGVGSGTAPSFSLPSGCSYLAATSTTWNGSTWSNGSPSSTVDAVIASSTTPGTFTCKGLTINSGVALTMGSGTTANINGNVTNNGNGFSGVGTFNFAASGSISGNAISCAGTITVASGATLTTGGLLTLTSDATNTGRIGNSAGTISGNVQVQRYIPGGRRAYRFFAHPFTSSQPLSILTDDIDITGSGGATNGFTTTGTNNPSSYWYDVTTANGSSSNDVGWTAFTSASTNSWDQYEGIRVLVRGAKTEGLTSGAYTPSAVTLDMTGAVNQGTQSISVTKGSGTTYALVGNPFPSPVSMDATSKTAGIGSNFYIWSAQQGTKGGYTTYSYGSSSFNLPVCGAFVTQISSNGTITIEEADKTGSTGTMFKTTSFPNRVTLNIEDSTIFWDRLQLHYNDNNMAVAEADDAIKFPNPEVTFSTFSKDDSALAIDNRPYAENESITLGFNTPYQKNYKIVASEFDIPAGTKLYLKDNYTGKNEEITLGYEYWFTVDTSSASQGKARFELNAVGKPTNGISTIAKENKLKVKLVPNPVTNNVTVYYEEAGQETMITITDMMGAKVAEMKAGSKNGNVVVPMSHLSSGIYIVNIRSGNAAVTQKLIKQ